jgi:hypothetical protein
LLRHRSECMSAGEVGRSATSPAPAAISSL